MSAFWKLVISSWFIVFSLFVIVSTASAQSPLPTTISPTSPVYTDLLVHNLFHTFSCLSVGSSIIGQPCLTYQITQNAQGAIQSVPILSSANLSGGLLGATTGLIAGLYANPPVRTADYLASVGEGLGIVKEAKAQGVVGSGAQVLNPIIKLWQVSRNISYVIMIIIFVIIGFMVMFRQRINPQTVITAQAALPGLVIGLILITFSYFLAALISDVAFIGTNLVGYYFSIAQGTPGQNLVQASSNDSVISIFSNFVGIVNQGNASSALSSIWENLGGGVQTFLRLVAAMFVFQQAYQATGIAQIIPKIGLGIQAAISSINALAAAANPTGVLGLLLSFIAILILLYTMFKLLLRLVNNFLSIIFLTITAPFQFLAAALPGRQGIATGWLLNMLANVLAFPAVLAVFYFVAYLLGQPFGPLQVSTAATLTGTSAFPLFGGLDLSFIRILLAFGALVATPSIPDIINRTIGRVTQAGQLLGQEISGGIGAGRGYSGQFQQGLGGIGERGGGLYTKSGLQEVYDPNQQRMVLVETKTPGYVELIKRRFGRGREVMRGKPAVDTNPT